jgi:hypothetical protein
MKTITNSQIKELLDDIGVRHKRKYSDLTYESWCNALCHLRYEEVKEAIFVHYKNSARIPTEKMILDIICRLAKKPKPPAPIGQYTETLARLNQQYVDALINRDYVNMRELGAKISSLELKIAKGN